MIALALLLAAAPVEGGITEVTEECHLALLDLEGVGLGEEGAHIPRLLTDTLATELGEALGCKVVSQAEIAQMLNLEVERQACGLEETSCLAEISEAFGVARVIGGTVGKLGGVFSIQVRHLNIETAEVLKRVEIDVEDEAQLRLAAREAAYKLMGKTMTTPGTSGNPALYWTGAGLLITGGLAMGIGTFVMTGVEAGFQDPEEPKQELVYYGWFGLGFLVGGAALGAAGGTMMWMGVE